MDLLCECFHLPGEETPILFLTLVAFHSFPVLLNHLIAVDGHASRTGPLLQWGSLGIYGTGGAVETLEIEPLSGHPSKLSVQTAGGVPLAGLTPLGGDEYAPVGWLAHVDNAHAAIPEPHVYADIMHAVDCIRDRRSPIASGEHAAHVVEIIEKGYLAAETGQTQTLRSRFSLPPP